METNKINGVIKKLNTVKDTITEIDKALNMLKEAKEHEEPKRIYVPKEIGLYHGSNSTSIGIINPLEQRLLKNKGYNGFSVTVGAKSVNMGNNFYYEEVFEPEVNKTYFVSNNTLKKTDLKNLIAYVIFLDDECYCRWNPGGQFDVYTYRIPWDYSYEIIEVI